MESWFDLPERTEFILVLNIFCDQSVEFFLEKMNDGFSIHSRQMITDVFRERGQEGFRVLNITHSSLIDVHPFQVFNGIIVD